MQRLPRPFIDQLDIPAAITAETEAWRNLLPPEPWIDAVKTNATDIAAWVEARLLSGAHNAKALTVNARKGTQGTRPVPILGVAERVAYRALSDWILNGQPEAQRSAEDYRAFVTGPITYAYAGEQTIRRIKSPRYAYVVEADVAVFYQYVEHDRLRRELELQTGKIDAADYLTELLSELQDATYGLPQLVDSSDELSEVYIRIMERDLLRRGLRLWRYNDDFRVAASTYEEAQDVVEVLGEAARNLGLVLNDNKTFISRTLTYLMRYSTPDVDDGTRPFDPDDVQVASDYDLTDAEAVDAAKARLARLDIPPGEDDRIDLKALSTEDLRDLRSAVNTLRRTEDPGALARITQLVLFAPALTPRLCEYLVALHPAEPAEVEKVWDNLARDHATSLSEWQATWLTYVGRQLKLLPGHEERVTFVSRQTLRGRGGLLHAEGSLALASVAKVSFEDLDIALRDAPEALVAWYALAIKELSNATSVDAQRLDAVKKSSPLYRILLDS